MGRPLSDLKNQLDREAANTPPPPAPRSRRPIQKAPKPAKGIQIRKPVTYKAGRGR